MACNMESPGFKTMLAAWDEVYGSSSPFSVTGTLPCVRVREPAPACRIRDGVGRLPFEQSDPLQLPLRGADLC